MSKQDSIKNEQASNYMQKPVKSPVYIVEPLRPLVRINISLEGTAKRKEDHSDSEPYKEDTNPFALFKPVNLGELILLFLFSLKLSVLQQVPVEETEENTCTLALLLGIWLVENVRKHVVILDS